MIQLFSFSVVAKHFSGGRTKFRHGSGSQPAISIEQALVSAQSCALLMFPEIEGYFEHHVWVTPVPSGQVAQVFDSLVRQN